MRRATTWPEPEDYGRVERLIAAMQAAAAAEVRDGEGADAEAWVGIAAPDLANALLALLANVLEQSPAAQTPSGMRLLSEAVGKEVHAWMKDARRLRDGDRNATGAVN